MFSNIFQITRIFQGLKMINFKTLSKRISTNEEGIFYKSIINENGKKVDKAYIMGLLEILCQSDKIISCIDN
jgi:hypothetical protein